MVRNDWLRAKWLGIVILGIAVPAWAQPSTNVCSSSGGGPEICVRFDNMEDPPAQGTDFIFNFSTPDASNPSVAFLVGDNGAGTMYQWRVWSRTSSGDTTVRNVGSLTCPASYDFDVKLLNPSGGAGAASVGAIDLQPTSASKFSRLTGGHATGNVSGVIRLQESSGQTGGNATLTIEGSTSGTITIPTATAVALGTITGGLDVDDVTGTLEIENVAGSSVSRSIDSITGSVTIDSVGVNSGTLTVGAVTDASEDAGIELSIGAHGAQLSLSGTQSGDVTIATLSGTVHHQSNLSSTYSIEVGEFGSGNNPAVVFSSAGSGVGTVSLPGGISASGHVSFYRLFNGTINLHGEDVAGIINVGDGGSGDIINGGTIGAGGKVNLTSGAQAGPASFYGTATFENIAEDGLLVVETYSNGQGGHLAGTVTITDDVEGDLVIEGGLTSVTVGETEYGPGELIIEDDVAETGVVQIDGAVTGPIDIAGGHDGLLDLNSTCSGDISIGQKGSTGDIDIAGLCSGSITVHGPTTSFSDILLRGGLASGKVLTIGATLPSNASGKIEVGATGNVGLEGIIWIKKAGLTGGDQNGWIKVFGDLDEVGRIEIDNDANALIYVSEDAPGSIAVNGDVNAGGIDVNGGLLDEGSMAIDGTLYTDIDIALGTDWDSLIRITGGIEDAGGIAVNSSTGDYSADGDIHVGPASMSGQPSVVFDGSISLGCGESVCRVLNGSITVVGCHATDDDLDICLCQGHDNVNIVQTSCTHQVEMGPCFCP